ncbi:MAG: hypothetical protein M1504_00240 [Candidatus Marsarchaeota archaeon]|nr:hypothetical protein [Candidatus Marsarchaeota archaeon]
MGDVVVLCDYCGKIAVHTCKLCGKRVCAAHYDDSNGSCTACSSGRQAKTNPKSNGRS